MRSTWAIGVVAVIAVPCLMGCQDNNSNQSSGVPANTEAAVDCSSFTTDFDPDSDADIESVGDLRFISEDEAASIQTGASEGEVFCRLGFYFGGVEGPAGPKECNDGVWSWAVGNSSDEPDLDGSYPTLEVCFNGGRVVKTKQLAAGEDSAFTKY